ncbi:hypothetical protein BH23PAT1_BH23PAT1_0640 [soil metagenome]
MLANAPRSYREAFAGVLKLLRPHIEVLEVEPDELEKKAAAVRPDLVISGTIPPPVKATVPNWLELGIEDEVLIIESDTCSLPTNTNPGLYQLLSVIDRAEKLTNRSQSGKRNVGLRD